jgi:ureidoglycolate hydrolase
MIMKIKALNISKENFVKYGKLVSVPKNKPTSEDATYKFWSNLADYSIDGNTEIGLCTVYKQNDNIITGVERHLETPEILIAIDAPFILPLLMEGESEENMMAFKVDVGEAVVIDNGVWHGACLPVGKETASYFVIFRLNTPAEDVYKKNISPITIEM